ncbi:hypothetical protein Tco_0072522 [Tanacetum coccineum]
MTNLINMLTKFVNSNTSSTSGSRTLPSNTITNPKEDLKGITTRSGYQGPTIPTTSSSPPKVVERETEVTKDMVLPTINGSTKDVQPLVVQIQPHVPNSEPVVAPVSAPMPNPKSSILYPSRRNDKRRREKANDQIEKFYEIFKDFSFEISLTDALILMPKFASTLKALIGNKEKLSEMARTPLNEHCSVVILNNSVLLHQEEQFSTRCFKTEMIDNTIPYHQYLLDTEAQNVPTENANKVARDMLQRFNMPTQTIPMLSKKPKAATADLHKDLLGTRNPGLGYIAKRAQPVLYDADTLLHPAHHPVSIWDSEDELSREQAYWLPANEIASNASNPATPVTPFVHNRPPPSQVLFHLQKVNAVFHQFEEVKEYEQIFDDLDAEYERCVLDNKNLTIEKKNLLIKNDCLIAECLEKDICSIVLTSDIVVLPLDTDRIQLKDTITSLRIQLDGLKVENVSLKRRYDELSKANTHSRTAYTEKLSALTSENTKLKALVHGKTSSGPSTSEKPKVLASGMYTKSSKYIPPPKRANWVKPTPLPKKKQVTFQEPPRTSNRPTQKPRVQQNKKPNVPVNLSTRTKPATESRKPMPKCHTRNHRILPNKSVNARRAADHNRKLNVVDHNQFVIRSLKSVNTKTPQAKHSVNHTKKVWKATRNHNVNTTKTTWRLNGKVVGSVKPQWKPTGRHFALYDNCPLTRIMEPIVEPLELTPSVSSSSKVTMISRFTDCKLSDRKAGSKGLSDIFEC